MHSHLLVYHVQARYIGLYTACILHIRQYWSSMRNVQFRPLAEKKPNPITSKTNISHNRKPYSIAGSLCCLYEYLRIYKEAKDICIQPAGQYYKVSIAKAKLIRLQRGKAICSRDSGGVLRQFDFHSFEGLNCKVFFKNNL
jgi:hypothetical protein